MTMCLVGGFRTDATALLLEALKCYPHPARLDCHDANFFEVPFFHQNGTSDSGSRD
jgi:hypothetical protein